MGSRGSVSMPLNTRPSQGVNGIAWLHKRAFAKVLDDCDEAVTLNPKNALAYNQRAWILATCPNEKVPAALLDEQARLARQPARRPDGRFLAVHPVKAYPAASTSQQIHFNQLHAGCGQRVCYAPVGCYRPR
jgi:hypothetical protein